MAKLTPALKRTIQYAAVGILLLVIAGYFAFPSDDGKIQPLAYNHKTHIENAGLTCVDCHAAVHSSPSATIPKLETCSLCHSEEPISESPEEQKLLEFVAQGAEIPWERVYTVPDHVYFSHRRHVIGGELECEACHGNVNGFEEPIASPFLPITMENCMDCHRANNVTNDCLSCHR